MISTSDTPSKPKQTNQHRPSSKKDKRKGEVIPVVHEMEIEELSAPVPSKPPSASASATFLSPSKPNTPSDNEKGVSSRISLAPLTIKKGPLPDISSSNAGFLPRHPSSSLTKKPLFSTPASDTDAASGGSDFILPGAGKPQVAKFMTADSLKGSAEGKNVVFWALDFVHHLFSHVHKI